MSKKRPRKNSKLVETGRRDNKKQIIGTLSSCLDTDDMVAAIHLNASFRFYALEGRLLSE